MSDSPAAAATSSRPSACAPRLRRGARRRLDTRTPGVDRDLYDAYCEHLIVRDEECGRIVGTYRILAPEAARRVGGYYSDSEFDLTRLQHLRGRMVEVGRSCIDADYRSGAAIQLLWAGLGATCGITGTIT